MRLPHCSSFPAPTPSRRRPPVSRRRICAWSLLLLCSTPALAADPTAINVDGTNFRLAKADAEEPTHLREYVPEGESLESWTHLIGLRHCAAPETPRNFVEQLAAMYASEHPALECAGHQNRVTGQCALDFLLPGDGFVEWNFIRATPAGDGGIDVVQYAMRFPHDGHAADVNDALDAARQHLLPILANADFSEPAIDHLADADSG